MLIIENLLSQEQLDFIDQVLSRAGFLAGSRSARGRAAEAKDNLQLDRRTNDPQLAALIQRMDKAIVGAITDHTEFRLHFWPHRMVNPPIISRYQEGMEYGIHTDNPLMGTTNPVRVDVSCTIFLDDPESYDGGELVLVTPEGERSYKAPEGRHVFTRPTTHTGLPG